ncbi:C-C motif chemokine 20-like [Bombina bombina]|uniref:C-C motif chemokine 20-like n=1 Tax=Bombina bombina TaxID=8345 RepID=UPI00235B00C7|nr:C-C motif chemokine 20-like [Bombina bombina]
MNLSSDLAAILVLLTGLSWIITEVQAYSAFDCCYNYTNKKPRLNNIRSVSIQKSSEVCDIDAVVFKVEHKNKKGSRVVSICANPQEEWVLQLKEDAMKKLALPKHQQKRKKMGKKKMKGKRKYKRSWKNKMQRKK